MSAQQPQGVQGGYPVARASHPQVKPINNGGGGANPIYAVNYVNFCKLRKKWRKFL